MEPSFLERTAADWEALYYSLKLPGAVILTLNEAFSHPQASARGMRIRLVDHDAPAVHRGGERRPEVQRRTRGGHQARTHPGR